jgi:lycopene cyclase CruP
MTLTEQLLSQIPGNPLEGLRRIDRLWQSLKDGTQPTPTVIEESLDAIAVDWDVVVCGGTLGILLGAALAQRGWRVALLERGSLRGRDQEWNISRHELQVFVELALLTEAELQQAIATEYNPARIAFLNSPDVWVRDVLNIGVDPVSLLELLKQKFLACGGQLFEHTPFEGAIVHPNGVTVNAGQQSFKTRLVLDAMGHFSPIVQQARHGKKPDAVCLVVGTCASGFPENSTGDLMATFTPMQQQCQYFWEAFPARDGRTTYLFTYLDAHPDRPSLEALFDDYFRLMPDYQTVSLEQLQLKRALFGFFPCYRQSPLKPQWHRILPIGDSSGSQSPLSFGGFGAMVRHLARLTGGIHEALQSDRLGRNALALLQPYQPNLACHLAFSTIDERWHEPDDRAEPDQRLADDRVSNHEHAGRPSTEAVPARRSTVSCLTANPGSNSACPSSLDSEDYPACRAANLDCLVVSLHQSCCLRCSLSLRAIDVIPNQNTPTNPTVRLPSLARGTGVWFGRRL